MEVFLNLHRKHQDEASLNRRLASLHDDLISRQLQAEVSRQTLSKRNRELELRCHQLVRQTKDQVNFATRGPALQAILDYMDLMETCEDRQSPEFTSWIESCRKLARVCMG